MRMYDLIEHKDKSASNLSGGNKRKLCCAQALMGCPPVMFVDEVSAGVDPVARRKVWKAMQLEGKNSALVLTTHTMEEAESLANKIGIMASGKFKCFGTLQQI
jgi:ABC-type multidrug transport system ATPase subunit